MSFFGANFSWVLRKMSGWYSFRRYRILHKGRKGHWHCFISLTASV